MIESNLAIALGVFVEDSLKELRLKTKKGELRAPQVVDGYLPPKRTLDDDDFPFVIVRAEDSRRTLSRHSGMLYIWASENIAGSISTSHFASSLDAKSTSAG